MSTDKHVTQVKLCTPDGDDIATIHSSAVPREGDDIVVADRPAMQRRHYTAINVEWHLEVIDYDNSDWHAIVHCVEAKELTSFSIGTQEGKR